jgi:Flp pilus assembly protein TadD
MPFYEDGIRLTAVPRKAMRVRSSCTSERLRSTSTAALRLSVELDPSNATAYRILGHALSQSGRQSDAEATMRRARELDPLDALTRALSAQVAFQARDVAAAIDHVRRAISLDPNLWIGYSELGQAYEGAGNHDLALEAIADAERFAGGNSKIVSQRGYVPAKMDRVDAARKALNVLASASRDRYIPPYTLALIHAGLGEREAVFDLLERAYAARDVHLIYLPVDMKWDPYRADPRFAVLLARCGFGRGR